MDITEIVNIISSVGFPIVMCVLMYNYITKDSQATRETVTALKESINALEELIAQLIEKK